MYLQFSNHICIQYGLRCKSFIFYHVWWCILCYWNWRPLGMMISKRIKSTSKCSVEEELQEIHLTGFIHNLSSLLNFTESIYDSFSWQLTFCYRFAHSLSYEPAASPFIPSISQSFLSLSPPPFSFILCKMLPCFLLVLHFSPRFFISILYLQVPDSPQSP